VKTHSLVSIVFLAALAAALPAREQAQKSKVALPRISAAAVPLYPQQAYVSNIEGVVRLRVTTDGHRVVATHVEDGHKLLATSAEENTRTWQFAPHEATTFTVTYNYRLIDGRNGDSYNPTVTLRLPTEVEVSARRWPGTHDLPAKLK
jgi:hypothetical protein